MTEIALKPGNEITVIMMAGLQGAGKTTTTAKIAGKLKAKGRNPLLVACDVYRPAAIKQLQINGEKQGVEVFAMGESHKPANIAKAALEHAQKNGNRIVILDTAGRLHIDEDMMAELAEIKDAVNVHQTILVIDAMTGQDAVNVAKEFNEKIGVDGVIVTKLDGDTRGGAALSVKAVTGKPILYVGMGEKLSDLEQFYPDRMASRILGMGDVLTLIEKAEAEIDEEKAKQMSQKLKKAQFDFEDYLESVKQMKNMGGLGSIMSMMPALGAGMGKMKDLDDDQTAQAEKNMARMGGHDLFHDARGKKESGSSESFQKAQDCKRSRGRHQRSQPDGQAIRRDEEDDEDGRKKRQKRKVPPAVLKLVYRADARYIDNEKILWR